MYMCICRAVNDTDLDSLIEENGADFERIQSCCGAGTDCGSCLEKVKTYVQKAGEAETAAPAQMPRLLCCS